MSTHSQDQEIDLCQIGKGISNFFKGVIDSFFKFLFFLKKKFLLIVLLAIIGLVAAFLLGSKNYTHEVSVIPNFKSNEYLYTKIAQINSKLREKDRAFFSQIGIQHSDRIKKIEKMEKDLDPHKDRKNFIKQTNSKRGVTDPTPEFDLSNGESVNE
jgi:hypothetical protein